MECLPRGDEELAVRGRWGCSEDNVGVVGSGCSRYTPNEACVGLGGYGEYVGTHAGENPFLSVSTEVWNVLNDQITRCGPIADVNLLSADLRGDVIASIGVGPEEIAFLRPPSSCGILNKRLIVVGVVGEDVNRFT